MSYSRWGSRGSGHWYTYWSVCPKGRIETRDNALFNICSVAIFTSKDLRENIELCLKVVSKKDPSADKEKLDELKIYIAEFLKDIDDEYPK